MGRPYAREEGALDDRIKVMDSLSMSKYFGADLKTFTQLFGGVGNGCVVGAYKLKRPSKMKDAYVSAHR
jgi:hypothetical protein